MEKSSSHLPLSAQFACKVCFRYLESEIGEVVKQLTSGERLVPFGEGDFLVAAPVVATLLQVSQTTDLGISSVPCP